MIEAGVRPLGVATALMLLGGCVSPGDMGVMALDARGTSEKRPLRPAGGLEPGDLPQDGVLQLAYAPVATELDQASWEPLAGHLMRRLGVLLEPVPYDSYAEIIEAVGDGDADLALLAPLSYVLAREHQPGLEPLVQTLSDGKTSYSAYLFVARSSPYRSVEDLRGSRVAFVDERSTSGFLLPYAQMLDAGLDPERDLAELRFTGDHVGALRALAEGEVDAAASYADVLPWAEQRSVEEGWELPSLRLLGNAGRIPLDALCANAEVSEAMRAALREELLLSSTATPQGRAFFRSSGRIVGWTATSDGAYDGVRRVAERVHGHRGEQP